MDIKANQDEKYLHPKEVLITDFLMDESSRNEVKYIKYVK